jgi:hypothetical protein
MNTNNRKQADRECPKCAGRGVMKRNIHAEYEPCDCTKVPENFKPGEKVTFTIVRSEGNGGFRFSSREGTVFEDNGGATVGVAVRGRYHYPARAEVRRLNEKSALTEAFQNMADEAERAIKQRTL